MDNWKRIRMELASTAEFPAGSVGRAYLLKLPIADDDRVDLDAYRKTPSRAVVKRHWSSEPDESGYIVPTNKDWVICLAGKSETRLDLDGRALRVGEQFPLRTGEGDVLPLRIASIR